MISASYDLKSPDICAHHLNRLYRHTLVAGAPGIIISKTQEGNVGQVLIFIWNIPRRSSSFGWLNLGNSSCFSQFCSPLSLAYLLLTCRSKEQLKRIFLVLVFSYQSVSIISDQSLNIENLHPSRVMERRFRPTTDALSPFTSFNFNRRWRPGNSSVKSETHKKNSTL